MTVLNMYEIFQLLIDLLTYLHFILKIFTMCVREVFDFSDRFPDGCSEIIIKNVMKKLTML